MLKNIFWLIVGAFVGGFVVFQLSPHSPAPWQPVIEQTTFVYVQDILTKTQEPLQQVILPQKDKLTPELQEAVQTVEGNILKLRSYYLPLTEVRQLIYDADRLFYLKHPQQAAGKLRQAVTILKQNETSGHANLDKQFNDLIYLVEDLSLSMKTHSQQIADKFQTVAHRVNMMLYRGELILSDEQF